MLTIINDRYEIGTFQKYDASGKIYDAYDKKLDRKVIIKIVDTINSNITDRFIRFIKNSGQLIHPSILTVLDFGIEDNFCYSVHEYINTTISQFSLNKAAILDTKNKLDIVTNILDCINFAHSMNIQHHNLYFDSIYLIDESNIKIDNFDLRRFPLKDCLYSELGIETKTQPIIPPELFYGKPANHTLSDIFQIGAISYALFCEIYPFGDKINENSIKNNRNSNFYDPKKFSTIPEKWCKIINTCMQKDPADRPQTIDKILAEKNLILQNDTESNNNLPSSRAYQFSIKNDTTHITINPNNSNINIEELETKLINENIYNYDIKKIKEAIILPHGIPHPIGDALKKCNPDNFTDITIEITANANEAYINIPKQIKISEIELEFYLKKNGLRFGITKENLAKSISSTEHESILIAKGTSPISGKDAYLINYFEDINPQKPKFSANGSANFKETHFIQEVKQEDIICIKVPATEGINGRDIYNKLIKATPGKDIKLPAGKNTFISGDGLKLQATIEGQINFSGTKVDIKEAIIILGDVDYSVGNINYQGDVSIRGDVLPDFSVTAMGNITINGVVEGANITSQKGSIKIVSGIFGKEKSIIKALKSIKADFVQDAEIYSECDVNITNYVMNSKIYSGRYFRCHKGIGSVHGSTIEASRTIDINIGGTSPSVKSFFTIKQIHKNMIKNEINMLLENINNIMASQKLTKQQLKKVILKCGSIEDAIINNEYKLFMEKLKNLETLKQLTQEKLHLANDNFEYCTGIANYSISVRRHLYGDVIFKIKNSIYKTDREFEGKVIISLHNNELKIKSR